MKLTISILIVSFVFLLSVCAQVTDILLPRETKLISKNASKSSGTVRIYKSSLPREELIDFYVETLASLGFEEAKASQGDSKNEKLLFSLRAKSGNYAGLMFFSSEEDRITYALVIQNNLEKICGDKQSKKSKRKN